MNVTQSREQERALRFSERDPATMDAAQVGVFILQDFKFTYVNPMLVEMFGYRDDELVGKLGPPDVVIPEQHELLIGKMRRRAAGEVSAPYELTGLRKNGSTFPLMVMGRPLAIGGRPASVGTLIDLSVQRQTEQELKDKTRRYAALFEGAQDAILVATSKAPGLSMPTSRPNSFLRPREELIGMFTTAFRTSSKVVSTLCRGLRAAHPCWPRWPRRNEDRHGRRRHRRCRNQQQRDRNG